MYNRVYFVSEETSKIPDQMLEALKLIGVEFRWISPHSLDMLRHQPPGPVILFCQRLEETYKWCKAIDGIIAYKPLRRIIAYPHQPTGDYTKWHRWMTLRGVDILPLDHLLKSAFSPLRDIVQQQEAPRVLQCDDASDSILITHGRVAQEEGALRETVSISSGNLHARLMRLHNLQNVVLSMEVDATKMDPLMEVSNMVRLGLIPAQRVILTGAPNLRRDCQYYVPGSTSCCTPEESGVELRKMLQDLHTKVAA